MMERRMNSWEDGWVDKWRRITGCGWIDGQVNGRVANMWKVACAGEGKDEEINALRDG